MKIDVEFSKDALSIDVDFKESDQEFGAGMGEILVLHDGQNGATFKPAVSAEGVVSWTNDRDLPNPAPVNIMGPAGPAGEKGEKGDPGPQGPKGDTGPAGADGAKGDKGDKGDTGPQGPQGPAGADGTMSFEDLTPEQKASLKGDKGDTGPAGPQGPQGDKGDPGAPGKDGVNGKDGSPGKDGADGISPVITVENIDGGHRVTITDKNGAKQFDVMDGKDGEGGSGGEVHWDDVQGKPVVSVGGSDTLTWDGNAHRLLVTASNPDLSGFIGWYKMSDIVFTDDEIKQMTVDSGIIGMGAFTIGDCWEDTVYATEDIVVAISEYDPFVVFVRKPNASFPGTSDFGGSTFPETGVYFFAPGYDEGNCIGYLTFPNSACFNAQEKIAPSHLYQPDWEQMDESASDFVKNKPFGEMPTGGDTLYWDGNTEGLLEIASDAGTFYKVSDVVLTEDDFFNTGSYEDDIVRISGDSGVIFSETNDDVLDAMFAELGFGIIGDWVFCAPTDNYEVPAFGITLPEAGIYFNASYGVRSFHVAKCTRFPSTKLMDTKYLPMDDITAAVIAALPVYDGEVVTE